MCSGFYEEVRLKPRLKLALACSATEALLFIMMVFPTCLSLVLLHSMIWFDFCFTALQHILGQLT